LSIGAHRGAEGSIYARRGELKTSIVAGAARPERLAGRLHGSRRLGDEHFLRHRPLHLDQRAGQRLLMDLLTVAKRSEELAGQAQALSVLDQLAHPPGLASHAHPPVIDPLLGVLELPELCSEFLPHVRRSSSQH
jgi:hypothetical protein